VLKVNEYFNGHVKSIGLKNNEGTQTIGVMAKGEYEFGTSTKEVMKIISGNLKVKLPNAENFVIFSAGDIFEVASHVKFSVIAEEEVAYICKYE
jgi:purine/pyrimidine-nucleoside phosphorylase